MASYLTGNDGRFSFAGIKSGRYLLRAGTRDRDQYNEIFVILVVKPGSKSGKGLEIVLTLGT